MRNRRTKQERPHIGELIKAALSADSDEDYWAAVRCVHDAGDDMVFEAVSELVRSSDPQERTMAADLLQRAGKPDGIRPEESFQILTHLLKDPDPNVVLHAAATLGQHASRRAIPLLVILGHDANPELRLAAAYGLSYVQEDPVAAEALVELLMDSNSAVRARAAFALAFADPAMEAATKALRQRVHDEDAEVRGEVLLGLAYRNAPGIVELLIKELSSRAFADDAIDAAAETADSRLLPVLMELKREGVQSMYLDLAIESCGGDDEKNGHSP